MSALVRIASMPDEDRLFAFVWSAYEEMPHATKSERKVRDVVRAAVSREATDFSEVGTVLMPPIFALIDGPGGIEAAVGLHPEQWWYSDKYALRGFFFYVHPDHQRGKGAHTNSLRDFSVGFAAQIGMPLIQTCFSERKEKVYARGMAQIGTVFATGLAA